MNFDHLEKLKKRFIQSNLFLIKNVSTDKDILEEGADSDCEQMSFLNIRKGENT